MVPEERLRAEAHAEVGIHVPQREPPRRDLAHVVEQRGAGLDHGNLERAEERDPRWHEPARADLRVQGQELRPRSQRVREGAHVPVPAQRRVPARGDRAARAEPAAGPFPARTRAREVETLLGGNRVPADPARHHAELDRELGDRGDLRGGESEKGAVGRPLGEKIRASAQRPRPVDAMEFPRRRQHGLEIGESSVGPLGGTSRVLSVVEPILVHRGDYRSAEPTLDPGAQGLGEREPEAPVPVHVVAARAQDAPWIAPHRADPRLEVPEGSLLAGLHPERARERVLPPDGARVEGDPRLDTRVRLIPDIRAPENQRLSDRPRRGAPVVHHPLEPRPPAGAVVAPVQIGKREVRIQLRVRGQERKPHPVDRLGRVGQERVTRDRAAHLVPFAVAESHRDRGVDSAA